MLLAASTTAVHAQVLTKPYTKGIVDDHPFLRAQRSGNGPNWLIAEHEPTKTANGISGNLKAFVKGKSYERTLIQTVMTSQEAGTTAATL